MATLKKRIHLIAAARPNFMKIAPLYHVLKKTDWVSPILIHTGQHYDVNMSDAFFQDFNLPDPHVHLKVGSGSHGEQTGKVLISYEKELEKDPPDLTVVVGDVNSTMAAALAAVKLYIPTAHLEAGLRSFDRTMPEEINRVVTDAVAELLWTPSPDADENLKNEGIPESKIERVGNIMIDSLEMLRPGIEKTATHQRFKLETGKYGLVTLHRPSNVDDSESLSIICNALNQISREIPLIFPVHPRTRKNLEAYGLMKCLESRKDILIVEPMSYISFMSLLFHCQLVITDSGGLQEETTYLRIPCFTLRPNTERPITIHQGTNQLCTPDQLAVRVERTLENRERQSSIPEFWDGRTAERVLQSIGKFLGLFVS